MLYSIVQALLLLRSVDDQNAIQSSEKFLLLSLIPKFTDSKT